AAVFATVAACVLTLMCVVASRAAATAAGDVLRSRRGRDVGVIALALFAAALFGVAYRFRQGVDELVGLRPSALVDALSVWPPGARPGAVTAAGENRLLLATALLAYGAATTLGLAMLWSKAIERAIVTPGESVAGPRRIADGSSVRLTGRAMRWLP